ncbi:rapunzel 3 [Periophthalmus magnuspinnatus]|uniref:rapunzel 3 n=1 Tax=Periophthalmus magnuspinnatus TaxID=409849 RepID=UPI00145BBEF2|nr:rapunzel 3 [Periophthalmus magnuspinnatus]
MSASLERLVAQKKEAIEAVMDMLERGAEVLASAVGEFLPLCEAAAPLLRLALDNVQSKEVFYVKEQFLTVRRQLDLLSTQLHDIDAELQRARLDTQYFSVEENIRNQFRKYVDILEAKAQFREVKTRLFLEHFSKSGGDKNLHVLYSAMMGTNLFGESVLELVDRYLAHNRRLLEDFCVRMKELFCLGLIALLGHCALTQGPEEEEELIGEWSARMEEVEAKMKDTIASCIEAFPEQAKEDSQRFLQESEEEELQQVAEALLQALLKKYDWVSWSVRVIKCSSSAYRSWRAGEHFHHITGDAWFEVPPVRHLLLVVSYSSDPRPVPRQSIQELVEAQSRRAGPPALVEHLTTHLQSDRLVVHAITRHKDCAAAWSFSDDCHYWDRHKTGALCVHSE